MIEEIAIVGGGCSGVLVAVQLLRNGFRGQVSIIEPRERLGTGLAYSTSCEQHLLNVPAGKMSALPSQPLHFLDWLRSHQPGATANCFAPRRLYGEYLHQLLARTLTLPGVRFRHIRASVTGIERAENGARLTLSDGKPAVQAGKVVLAVGNPASSHHPSRPGWHVSPWFDDALRVRFAGEKILVLGTGLTGVDSVIALQSQKLECQVYMLSRGGILPKVHKPAPQPAVTRTYRNTKNLRLLLREVRKHVEATRAAGLCWRAVVDSLRAVSNDIWSGFSLEDKQRFLRHLKRYWEPHRHRMAPAIRTRLDRSLADGTLETIAGRIKEVRKQAGVMRVCVLGKGGEERILEVDRVISCTGIHEDYVESARQPIGCLIQNGIAVANDLGIGFRTDRNGALIDAAMNPSSVFFTLGPPRRGDQFETTAVPEIRTQAEALAQHLAKQPAGTQARRALVGVMQ